MGSAVSVISSKGGTGKTVTAVSLACWWAQHGHKTLLVDTDPQDVGSATWWLNRTDDRLANLSWVKTTPEELAPALNRLQAQWVMIDTPPRVDSQDLISIASLTNLVLIPGSPFEAAAIVQTAKTIQQTTQTPAAAVITRTGTQIMQSADVNEVSQALQNVNCPPIGQIRAYKAMAAAPAQGRRPLQLAGPAGTKLASDLQTLAHNVERLINHAPGK